MLVLNSTKSANTLILGGSPLERASLSRLTEEAGHTAFADDGNGGEMDRSEQDISLILLMETNDGVPQAIRQALLRFYHSAPVVIFSSQQDLVDDLRSSGLTIAAIVDPSTALDRIPHVLQLVLDGLFVFPPSFFGAAPKKSEKRVELRGLECALNEAEMTPREMDVAALISLGKTNKQIARKLGIAVNTVNVHVNSMMRKLNVENRTKIAIWYLTVGAGQAQNASVSRDVFVPDSSAVFID